MADVKTILRETSVIFGLTNTPIDNISAEEYLFHLKNNLVNYDDCTYELNKIDSLTDHKSILANGYNIGEAIRESKGLNGPIRWTGSAVKFAYPFDIIIGDYGVSLKEHSYILKNPALSEYINSLTQVDPPLKTVHIFRYFAPQLFEEWFSYTLRHLFETTNDGIILENTKRGCQLTRVGDDIFFSSANDKVRINKDEIITELDFNKRVNGFYREYLYSRWIKAKLEKEEKYIKLKKMCSEKAGENLKEFIEQNFNINKKAILGLFQIYDKRYLYAKTGKPPIILDVPSIEDVDVELTSTTVSVPRSQLNILFEFTFIANGKESHVNFRVECRYSHGQLNGVPEAKLYYADNDQISNIYNKLIVEDK